MKNDYRKLVIKGSKELSRLERFVEEICDYYNINNEYFGNVLLATTEAASILFSIHEEQVDGSMTISFDRNPKGLMFKIRLGNRSKGTMEKEDDELDKEIKKHKLSREIFIIKALSDEITISFNAKSIILVFYVSSMNYEKSLKRITQLKEYWNKQISLIEKKNE
ncbi:MAG: hypothetical protein PHF97_01225 [Bacteroidales bacterium]|nr:hypothetical protein [Bacteroidales bacterium]MDD4602410.1 hypothetical protein [Bacteroidales bacterium]